MGMGMIALATLLSDDQLLAVPKKVRLKPPVYNLVPKRPHIAPRAKAMISLFQHGGPSHMDLMDPRPELSRLDGKTYEGEVGFSFIKRATKRLKGTPWKFFRRSWHPMQTSLVLWIAPALPSMGRG